MIFSADGQSTRCSSNSFLWLRQRQKPSHGQVVNKLKLLRTGEPVTPRGSTEQQHDRFSFH